MRQGKKIWVGIAGIGVDLLCVAAVALKAPTAVWVLALLIGTLLLFFALVIGEPVELDAPGQRAEGGIGEGHVRGNVIGDNATITISGGAEVPVQSARKSLVRLSVRELTKIYQEHTAVQAEKLIDPYIGGWLKVRGSVNDVTKEVLGEGYRTVVAVGEDLVFAGFVQESQDELPRLLRNEKITIVGRIAKVEAFGLQLEESELLGNDS